jgi:hypothetical protein
MKMKSSHDILELYAKGVERHATRFRQVVRPAFPRGTKHLKYSSWSKRTTGCNCPSGRREFQRVLEKRRADGVAVV